MPAPPRRRIAAGRRLLGAGIGLLAVWLGWEVARWPEVAALITANPQTTAFIERYRAGRAASGQTATVAWSWVGYGAISPHLKRAVLVGEDIGFFSHKGFAPEEMKAALHQAWERRQRPRGASTITQQVAKNLWLSPSRSPLRKLREAILTRQLEQHLEKRRILEIYLNVAEFGPGVFGAEAASRRYFGRPASELSPREAAMLAASLPYPRRHPPGSPGRAYSGRVRTIERRMEAADWLWKVI